MEDFLPDGIDHERQIGRRVEVPVLSDEGVARITRMVFYAPEARVSDVMLVFGSPEGDWRPAAEAYRHGLVPLIVVSGGKHPRTGGATEAALIKVELVRLGVPEEAVVEDGRAINTLENVLNFRDALQERDIKPRSILYLSNRHHAGRCYLTLKKYFPEAIITALTHGLLYSGLDIWPDNWMADPAKAALVYGEYVRIMTYSAKGDIMAPDEVY